MQRAKLILTGSLLIALPLAGWAATRRADTGIAVEDAVAGKLPRREAEELGREIERFELRSREDPYSAADLARLASLYLQRARETGDHGDVVRAEETARRSLEIRSVRNEGAVTTLTLALLNQHRFVEALEQARHLVKTNPESTSHRALLGEVQMELGDYAGAAVTLGSVEPARRSLSVAPRLARWEELHGRVDRARALLYEALDQAQARTDLSSEQLAWFHLRVGDLELRHGRLREAERALRAGLAVAPDDFRLLHAMARLEAARRRWPRSIAYGERVLGQLLDPATLVLMSQVYEASGQPDKAAEYAGVMAVAIQGQPMAYHREWSLFLLDQGDPAPEVLKQVTEELKTRRDVYGYDVLAWALHREGRDREAEAAMKQALRLGTRDPLLLFHSAMIQGALGRTDTAEAQLVEALAINPRFHPVHAEGARVALDSLRGGRPWYRRLRP